MNTEEKGSDFPKAGFSRLIRLFENTDDVVKLTRAFGLASKVHRGQLFNRSEPYINHSLRVAMILVEELQIRDPQIVCAALLHDATDASDEEIRDCVAETVIHEFGHYFGLSEEEIEEIEEKYWRGESLEDV